jgi:hypothetical protein
MAILKVFIVFIFIQDFILLIFQFEKKEEIFSNIEKKIVNHVTTIKITDLRIKG